MSNYAETCTVYIYIFAIKRERERERRDLHVDGKCISNANVKYDRRPSKYP
jgi:hypothetical protein